MQTKSSPVSRWAPGDRLASRVARPIRSPIRRPARRGHGPMLPQHTPDFTRHVYRARFQIAPCDESIQYRVSSRGATTKIINDWLLDVIGRQKDRLSSLATSTKRAGTTSGVSEPSGTRQRRSCWNPGTTVRFYRRSVATYRREGGVNSRRA